MMKIFRSWWWILGCSYYYCGSGKVLALNLGLKTVGGSSSNNNPVAATCNPSLATEAGGVCVGSTVTTNQLLQVIPSNSNSSSFGLIGDNESWGPWSTPGLYTVALPAGTGKVLRTIPRTCLVRVIDCGTNSKATDSVWTCPRSSLLPPVRITPNPTDKSLTIAVSGANQLCVLTLSTPQTTATRNPLLRKTLAPRREPMGRSYLGYDWEAYAGHLADLKYDCRPTSTSSTCQVTLPPSLRNISWSTSASSTQPYLSLTTYEYTPKFPAKDTAARFLEHTTFGPTMAEILALSSGSTSPAAWIQQQQDTTLTPVTSHRQFFRERATHRYEFNTPMGRATHPCRANSRFRRYALTRKDDWLSMRLVAAVGADQNTSALLLVSGLVRTLVPLPIIGYFGSFNATYDVGIDTYTCANAGEMIGGYISLGHPIFGCSAQMYFGSGSNLIVGNPPVRFTPDNPPARLVRLNVSDGNNNGTQSNAVPIDTVFYGGQVQELLLATDLNDSICNILPAFTGQPERAVFGVSTDMSSGQPQYWIHSPTFDLLNNTMEQPISDGGGAVEQATSSFETWGHIRCANAPRTFLNEDTCRLSNSSQACTAVEFPPVVIPLEPQSFRTIYRVTGGKGASTTRYVYSISQLRQNALYDAPPCRPGARSRWVPSQLCWAKSAEVSPLGCAELGNSSNIFCSKALPSMLTDNSTTEIFRSLFQDSRDDNPYLVDIYFPSTGVTCHPNDVSRFDFTVMTDDGKCWLNVHPDTYQVFDFTVWTTSHPGNTKSFNPIKNVAEVNDTYQILFPASHTMDRWYSNKARFTNVGRLGDKVNFKDLPPALASDNVAYAFGDFDAVVSNGHVMVCGSPYEVENHPNLYDDLNRGGFDLATYQRRTTTSDDFIDQRTTVWMEIALRARDQLRQRVAWALSQILVVSPDSIAVKEQTENFVTYYDIFVRHAFGNYRDILKEVSFSPIMAEMLTYRDSKSTAFIWDTQKSIQSADENYAREIMQLFSIGLVQLNSDGTHKRLNGEDLLFSYTNNEITEYARVWTGFSRQKTRANVEHMNDPSIPDNQIDPMLINTDWRDHLPKLGLKQMYIGDGWPLCSDLPPLHFLQKGAKFRQLGSSSTPRLLASVGPQPRRFVLNPASSLYAKLCDAPSGSGACNFKSVVILNETIPCYQDECQVNALRTFETDPGTFYEYVRPPCVFRAFFDDAQMVKTLGDGRDIFCAEPKADLASTTCCNVGGNQSIALRSEYFSGERVPLSIAQDRCNMMGGELCSFPYLSDCQTIGGCDPSLHYWSSQGCQVKAKINIDGRVAIVHSVDNDLVKWNHIGSIAQERTVSYFRVVWTNPLDSFLANYTQQCLELGCEIVQSDQLCLCDTSVSESAAFLASEPPTREQVLGQLYIGAFLPVNTTGVEVAPGVTMYSSGMDAVFEVVDNNGILQRRRNLLSTVTIGNGGPSFRNPLHFISLSDPELRDAEYETDAALDHYFYHDNTAPFLAIRFAQRFGVSNPSPRYVREISAAFRSGRYVYTHGDGTSKTFGSGVYGDMAATIAAVLLDREANTILLDADPFHGSIQEPFLKIMRLMRSLEYQADSQHPLIRVGVNMLDFVGQEPHKLPNVFSFFKPLFQPKGAIEDAGFVSPESQVLNGPKSSNLVNAMLSYLKYGLKACNLGFGTSYDSCNIGYYDNANGHATFSPKSISSKKVVDDLATLLTSGRLSAQNRNTIENAYRWTLLHYKSFAEALINAEQLIALTPEFHSSGLARTGLRQRPVPSDPPASKKPYKSIIYLFLDGGYDSYSMLVPHNCTAKNSKGATLRQQYDAERGMLAFLEGKERSVIINATASNQPCEEFALHDELTLLKQLYEDGDLTFLANTGLIDRNGMNKDNYYTRSVTPLFAHDTMQLGAQKIDPFSTMPGSGVLGRAADVLTDAGYKVNTIAMDNVNIAVNNQRNGPAPPTLVVGSGGAQPFSPKPGSESYINTVNYVMSLNKMAEQDNNVFGETWSNQFVNGIQDGIKLNKYLDSAKLSNVWNPSTYSGDYEKQYLYERFNTIAKLIKTHDKRGTDRDFFYMTYGGWDHHTYTKESIRPKFKALNYGLDLMVQELKNQSMWDNVTIMVISEFARTINANSGFGCDHAWGGHYFMTGGSVKGGRILGQYPNDITADAPLLVGSGRVIPTTSWDAVWNGVVEWTGVNSTDSAGLGICLPNRLNTPDPGFALFSKEDLFK